LAWTQRFNNRVEDGYYNDRIAVRCCQERTFALSRKIVVHGLPSFFLHKTRIYAKAKEGVPDYSGSFSEKGNPVEKQGRKVSGLRGKTYDSGAAKV
jgi:hypothetical protein